MNGQMNEPRQQGRDDHGRSLCDELLAMATADIYRKNLFRVLDVPVTAGPAEIRRRQSRRDMERRLGLGAAAHPQDGGARTGPSDESAAAQATERLHDPIRRFLDELFWFWPVETAGAADTGLAAIGRGDVDTARATWARQAAGGDDAARHNLAILAHLGAVEKSGDAEGYRAALERWEPVLESPATWRRAEQRIREIGDVRLTTGFLRRVRETMPRALLLIGARIAVDAAERGDVASAARYAALVREARLATDLGDDVLRDATKPLRDRIDTGIATARECWKRTPQKGAQALVRLHDEAVPVLAVVDAVLPEDSPTRHGLHDVVADAMLAGQIAFAKATNDWKESERLLRLARALAASEVMASRLDENIRIVRENDDSANDWCAPGYWDLPADVVAELEAARARAEAGDFSGALDILLSLDAKAGKPLRRAVGYCLSVQGIRRYNAAIGEHKNESGVIKIIMDKVRSGSHGALLLLNRPTPNSVIRPPCLACGSMFYTQWVTFTYKDLPLFMCMECSARHDREVQEKTAAVADAAEISTEMLLLADEIDPGDAGVRRNLDAFRKEIGSKRVDTAGLRARLTRSRRRLVRDDSHGGSDTDPCFFCGRNAGAAECGLRVPMHEMARKVALVFGEGREYRVADVAVPRCAPCQRRHRELPGEIEAWHAASREAASRAHLTAEFAAEDQASEAVARAEADLASARDTSRFPAAADAVARAADVERAAAEAQTGITGEIAAAAADVAVKRKVSLWARLTKRPNPALDAALAALARAEGRLPAAEQRVKEATERHRECLAALARAQDEGEARARATVAERKARLGDVRSRREAAQAHVIAAYKAAHSEPQLGEGIRPEAEYEQYAGLARLAGAGWHFGLPPVDEGAPGTRPSGVTGLVARAPRLGGAGRADARRTAAAAQPVISRGKFPAGCDVETSTIRAIKTGDDYAIGIASDGTTGSCASVIGYKDVWFDGRHVGTYERVYGFSLRPGADGRNLCFETIRGGKAVIVQNGRFWPACDDAGILRLTGDGAHASAILTRDGKRSLAIDGSLGPEFDQIPSYWLGMREGKLKNVYLARSGKTWYFVEDHVRIAEYDKVGFLFVSPDRDIVRYWASRGGRWFPVVNGREGDSYDDVHYWTTDGSGERDVAAVRVGDSCHLLDDGEVLDLGRGIDAIWLKLPAGGAGVAYVVRRGAKYFVSLDGKEGPPLDEVDGGGLVLSPDGQRYGCIVKADGKKKIVIDGEIRASYDEAYLYSIHFSADSKHVAWVGQHKGGSETRFELIMDQTIVANTTELLADPWFHPHFEEALVYKRGKYRSSGWTWTFVLGGRDMASYELISGESMRVRDDGSFTHLAIRDGNFVLARYVPH